MEQVTNALIIFRNTVMELALSDKDACIADVDLPPEFRQQRGMCLPEDQYCCLRIEQKAAMNTIADWCKEGKKVFVHLPVSLITFSFLEVLNTTLCNYLERIVIVGIYSGLPEDGRVFDYGLMGFIDAMELYQPSDFTQIRPLVEFVRFRLAPVYMRVPIYDMECLNFPNKEFLPGDMIALREGQDICIFASGDMVARALMAARRLVALGIDVAVLDVPALRPYGTDVLRRYANRTGRVLICEEHIAYGGLGESLCAALAMDPVKVGFIHLRPHDRSGVPLPDRYAVGVQDIVDGCRGLMI